MDFNMFKDCEDLKKNISSIVFWTFATFDMSNHAFKNLKGMPALTCVVFFSHFVVNPENCVSAAPLDMTQNKVFPHLLKIVERGVCEAGF